METGNRVESRGDIYEKLKRFQSGRNIGLHDADRPYRCSDSAIHNFWLFATQRIGA
jgi:hypothetical protein